MGASEMFVLRMHKRCAILGNLICHAEGLMADKRIAVIMPQELHDALLAMAKADVRSLNSFLVLQLKALVAKETGK